MTRLRIVTLNTWKGDGAYIRRLDRMAAGLRALAPDLVFLQECLRAPDAGWDTSAHLASALGLACAHAEARAKPRSVEGRMTAATSGVAILSRAPLVHVVATPLPTSARDGGREALVARCEADGCTLELACVHLSHLPGGEGVELRQRQLLAVLGVLEARAPGAASVIAGDFNARFEADEMEALAADPDADWGDAEHRSLSTRLPGPGEAPPPPGAIDHIVVRDPGHRIRVESRARALTAGGEGAADDRASDHTAVVCDIGLAP